MKKLVVVGMLVVLSSGCGRGWLPLFRGAPCRENCGANVLPVQPNAGCNGCATGYGTSYSAYDGEVIGDAGYYGSSIVGDGYLGAPATTVPPSTAPAP